MIKDWQLNDRDVEEEKDLGVLISKDLKPSKQCVAAANKARSVLGNDIQKLQSDQQKTVLKSF